MKHKDRVPELLFVDDHYLGRPADYTDRIISRRIRLVEQIPGFTGKDYTLLDIGCGNGASMFLLHDKMKHCLGLEICDDHLEEFNNYKAEHNIQNCDLKIVDIEQTTPDTQFDRIISFEVIEHLKDENSIRYYHQALKPDGLIAISVPNKWWIFETHGARLPLLKWNRVPFFSWLPKVIHEKYANARIYTKQRIVKLMEAHGFEILDTSYVMAPMDVLKDGKLKTFVVNNFFNSDKTKIPYKATSVFVVARKKAKH